ncbi:MAG: 16S rRNA (cytosine(1402)-N(4))-methyltransferase RsmH [Bacteroidetes bacterium]|nr:16S rRNA (cytosine(1402)-N(4))-methyltransferase RsmH [Bacteroidota bacterium]
MSTPVYHIPVLCRDAADFLITETGGMYVDGTVGGGGHAEEICKRLQGPGRLLCLDADEEALSSARMRLAPHVERTVFVRTNFRLLRSVVTGAGWTRIHGVLLDLGVSSHQLDAPERGFTFRNDERLDMRMDRRQEVSAWEIVNTLDEQPLAKLLWEYGEERMSRRIARRIVEQRPVETTGALRNVVASVVKGPHLTKSLARIFQALRIAVNGELESLAAALKDATDLLVPGGRIVVISYHSLEDRIVKEFFRSESTVHVRRDIPLLPGQEPIPRLRVLTRKPVIPSPEETVHNPRARSAKMRAAERRDVGSQRT